jgi:hypothetical protein
MKIEITNGVETPVTKFFCSSPETDANEQWVNSCSFEEKWEMKVCESRFARELERERNEWRKKFELSVDAVEVAARLARAESERDEANQIISSALAVLPVGYIPAHTAESIPNRIADLCNEIAKLERERDELRRMSVTEMMGHNLNVKHHVTEWENRCLKAERERDEARAGRQAYKQLAVKHAQERDEAREEVKELIYISERAIDLAEIDFENDKFGVVSELRSDLEKIKEEIK